MENTRSSVFEDGKVLLIDKPLFWTSFGVIQKIRHIIKVKKVGHAGTLDPRATGLLIVCTGKYTKRINEFMAKEKEYTGTFTLGATTASYDLETEPQNITSTDHLTTEQLLAATTSFTGDILQIPPAHSAIKVGGTRVYEMARQGVEVKLEPRKLFIREFRITRIELPVLHFEVICSTGTYIRSLAHDYGAALGCGAYLSSLRRTRIGEFSVNDASTVEVFEEEYKKMNLQNRN